MRITGVSALPVGLPFSHGGPPTGFGGKVWTTLDHLVVRVDTDEGVTGYGESFGFDVVPATARLLERSVAPFLLGRDPSEHSALLEGVRRALHMYGRQGLLSFALSGVDIALWDIAGKVAGAPLWRLFGGARRERVPAYASLLRYRDPVVVARVTEQALVEGYTRVKLHETGVDEVAAARRAAGPDVQLMLDVNCAWSPEEAVRIAAAMAEYDLHWLEEPTWPPEDFRALAQLRSAIAIPVAAGENLSTPADIERLLEASAVDYLQPSATKLGGLSELRWASALARERGVAVAPHSPYFGPGLLATLHAIAAEPAIESIETFYLQLQPDLFGGRLAVVAGHLTVPEGPGLGLDPDPAVLTRFRLDA